jgi:hypothetical protein
VPQKRWRVRTRGGQSFIVQADSYDDAMRKARAQLGGSVLGSNIWIKPEETKT